MMLALKLVALLGLLGCAYCQLNHGNLMLVGGALDDDNDLIYGRFVEMAVSEFSYQTA